MAGPSLYSHSPATYDSEINPSASQRHEKVSGAGGDPVATAFLILSLLFGSLFLFLTPPFQVPDEPAHFFRAYAISEGDFRVRSHAGVPAQSLPASLPAFAAEIASARIGDRTRVISIEDLRRAMRYRFEENDRVLAVIHTGRPGPIAYTAGDYLPIIYLPSSALLFITRALDAPVLVAFFLSRFLNLFISVILGYLAIRIAPFGKTILAGTGLLPMIIFLRSSISPDSLLIGLAMLAFALVLREAEGEFSPRPRNIALFLVICALIIVTKPFYVLLPMLALLIPRHRLERRRSALIYGAIFLTMAGTLLIVALWMRAPLRESREAQNATQWKAQTRVAHEARDREGPGVNVSDQTARVTRNPFGFVKLSAGEYWRSRHDFSMEVVGKFGWLDTPLPPTLRTMFLIFLIAIALLDGRPGQTLNWRQRFLLAAVFGGTLLLISGSLYITWTPVGASRIDGMQGRYFIPVLPAILLTLTSARLSHGLPPARRVLLLAIIVSIALGISTWLMLARFYGVVAPPV